MKEIFILKRTWLLFMFLSVIAFGIKAQTSITKTYSEGDLPTQYLIDPLYTSISDCPGVMHLEVPAGKRITTIDVEYDMSTVSNSIYVYISSQRSNLQCTTTNKRESSVNSNSSKTKGTLHYSRTGLKIAEGAVGTVEFILHAFRDYSPYTSTPVCGTDIQIVNNNTWKITAYLEDDDLWYPDEDGDLFVANNPIESTTDPSTTFNYYMRHAFPNSAFDCNDSNSAINPDVTEIIGDGFDNDCNSETLDIYSSPKNTDGDCGQIIAMNGIDDYLQTQISVTDQSFTLEGWVKLNNFSGDNFIFGGGTASANNGLHAGYLSGGSTVRFSFYGSGTDLDGTVSNLDTDWHHLAFTFDKENGNAMNIYFDAMLIASKQASSAYLNAGKLLIGKNYNTTYLNGALDNVKIWNKALSNYEIVLSANGSTIPDESSLLTASFDFNNLTMNETVTDLSGNNNSATLINMDAATAWLSLDGDPPGVLYYTDNDADGYLDDGTFHCDRPGSEYYLESEIAGSGKSLGDCNDYDATINPGAEEILQDGLDNDCNPLTGDLPEEPLNNPSDCGQVLAFDGTNDYVSVPYNAALNSTSFTASAWVKFEGGAGKFRAIVSNRGDGPTRGWILYGTDTNIFRLMIANSGGSWTSIDGPALVLNSWTHVAATFDGTNAILYINGEKAGEKTLTYVNNIANPLRIGAGKNESTTPDFYLNGLIDEVQLWNTALTEAEIANYSSGHVTGEESNLVAYYNFNNQNGSSTLADATGNHSGALINMDATTDWVKADGSSTIQVYYTDADGDGYVGEGTGHCSDPGEGYYLQSELAAANKIIGDCDDSSAAVNPGKPEILDNGIDDDCNSNTPDALLPAKSLDFDGNNDYISATGPDLANKSFSIEFWAKRSAINLYGMVFFMGSNSAGKGLNIPIMDNNKVRFSFYGADFDSNTTITDTNWHHFAMTYNSSNGAYAIYIDGVLDKSGSFSTTFTGSTAMLIGSQLNNGSRYFKGKLDEFRIWNKVLTSSEINDSKGCQLSGDETGLLAYYHFNQGSAGTSNSTIKSLTDASGNGYTGTLVNFGLSGTTSNWSDGTPVSICAAAPVLSTIGDQSLNLGESLSFNVLASDINSDVLTYSLDAASIDLGMTLNASTGAFSWIPAEGLTGNFNVTITVSDGKLADIETFTITINKLAQTITFEALEVKTIGDDSFVLLASASSGLSVSYTSSDETVATISGNTVTIVGTGTTTITASQSGDATYSAAAEVTQDLVVNPILMSQTITFDALEAKTVGDAAFDLAASASSGLVVTYTSSDETVATISGSTVTIVGGGTTTITASQSGNDTYAPAADVTQELLVNKEDQIVTFYDFIQKTYGDDPFDLLAQSNKDLPVTYSSSNESVATISGSTLTIVGAGTTTLTATQAGNSRYNAASATKEMVVNKSSQTITFEPIADVNLFDSTTVTVKVSASSGLPVSLALSDMDVATISGNVITINQTGVISILANQEGDNNYEPAETSHIFDVFKKYVWNGTEWNIGAPGYNDDIIVAGDFNTATNGNLIGRNMEIASNANITVGSNTKMQPTGNLYNQGNIIVESGATFFNYGLLEFTGKPITFRRNTRYADGRYSFVGSPVQYDLNILGSQLGSHVYRYDESASADTESLLRWIPATDEALVPGQGYTQAKQQVIEFVGIPNDGDITYPASYTNDGWHMVSNPYPASIELSSFIDANNSTTGTVYIWDDNGSETERGSNSDYIVANKTGATDNHGPDNTNRWNGYIGAMQGFFIQMNGQAGNVNFSEEMRVSNNNTDDNFFRTTDSKPNLIRINLTNDNGLFKQTILGWNEEVSDETINAGYDAKMFDPNAANAVYSLKSNTPLVIQTVTSNARKVPIAMNLKTNGVYQLVVDSREAQGQEILLKDNLTGKISDLNTPYSFSSASGHITNRFELLINSTILELKLTDFRIFAFDNNLNVRMQEGDQKSLSIYNLHGQHMLTAPVRNGSKINLGSYPAGIYIVTDEKSSIKIIIE